MPEPLYSKVNLLFKVTFPAKVALPEPSNVSFILPAPPTYNDGILVTKVPLGLSKSPPAKVAVSAPVAVVTPNRP